MTIDPTQFPGNSRMAREEPQAATPPRKVEAVTTGTIVKKKKSLIDRFAATFLGEEDAKSVGDYLVQDILIPAAKDTMYDMVHTAFDRVLAGVQVILFGSAVKPGTFGRNRTGSKVSYGNFFKDNSRRLEREDPIVINPRSNNRYDFDDIVIPNRDDANQVLELLREQIDDYNVATVADYLDAVNVKSQFVDRKYGWDDLSTAFIQRVAGGYTVALPKPREIR